MTCTTDLVKAAGVKREILEDILNQIVRFLQKGQCVKLYGFGVFERTVRHGRTLSTPAVQGGQPVTYPDSYAVHFRQSNLLKQRMNAERRPNASKPKIGKKTVRNRRKSQ
jgi:nucleoid DNA-binding protein